MLRLGSSARPSGVVVARLETMGTSTRLSEVHAQILRQHVEIRARMRGIERLADAHAKVEALRHLRVSLVHFAAMFEDHLAFEERELIPLVRGVDAWGPERVEAMLEEHREQRVRVERTVSFAEEGSLRISELEGEVHWLMESLLADMIREEDELRVFEEIDSSATPQMTG